MTLYHDLTEEMGRASRRCLSEVISPTTAGDTQLSGCGMPAGTRSAGAEGSTPSRSTNLYHDITDDGRPAIREHGSDDVMILDILADVEAAMDAVNDAMNRQCARSLAELRRGIDAEKRR